MSKKINIIQLVTETEAVYNVGTEMRPLGEGIDGVVERIIYEKHGYNKGKQGDFSSYVVFFSGDIRKIIPQNKIKSFVTEVVEEEIQTEIAPELPV